MKKLYFLAAVAMMAIAPKSVAESLVTESGTWNVTRTTKKLADGVQLTTLKWNDQRSTSYKSSLVYVVEADLSNPAVGLELITNGLTGTKTLANHAKAAKTGTPVAGANANFWITSPEAGNYACMGTQSHGVEISNGTMYTDLNMGNFKHVGGPRTRTGVFIVDNDGKAYLDFTKAQKANNASGSGVEFAAVNKTLNERMPLDMCNRWVAANAASIFTKEYGTTKAFRTGDKTSDSYTKVTGQATEVLLDFASGTTDWSIGGTTKFVVKEIRPNKGGGTLGDHDCAIVSRDSLATVCADRWKVGDVVNIVTKINLKSQGTPNGIAQATSGNVLAMQNGEFTTAIQAQEDAGNTYNTNWYARTLYGLNADRSKFYILVCEHYPNKTYDNLGFTTKQLCHIAKTFGCTEAFQPDCGGSAQMWTKDGQVSTSSDAGGVRAVHNGLYVVIKDIAEPDPKPDPEPTPEPGTPIKASDIKEEYIYSVNQGNLSAVAEFSTTGNVTRDMCIVGDELILLHTTASAEPVVTRHDAYNPTICHGSVNVQGVTGGTFYLGGIKRLGNWMIGANMAGAAGALKIYKWDDLTKAPEVILNSTDHGGIEVGRSFMTSGDESNGRIAFSAAGAGKVVYYVVKDGVINTTPVIINLTKADGTAYTQEGNASNQDVSFMDDGSFWLFNKDTMPVHFDATGKLITTLTTTHIGSNTKKYGQGGQAFTYAGNNYVAATATLGSTSQAAWGNVTMSLVDLSEGSTSAKHIGIYPAAGLGPDSWGGVANNAVDYKIEGDNTGLNLWVLAPMQGLARYSVGKVTTGVENIAIDNSDVDMPAVYYNINGMKVDSRHLAPGLYIRVRGHKTDKIIIQ